MLTRKTYTRSLQITTEVTSFLYLILVSNLLTNTGAELESWIDRGGGGGINGGLRGRSWKTGERNYDAGLYLNAFAITLKEEEGRDVAEKIALEHGFKLKFEVKIKKSSVSSVIVNVI